MRPLAARLGAVLICVAGLGLASAAPAAAQSLTVEVGGVPNEFTAGGGALRLSAVISGNPGGNCVKVRWSLLVRTDGLLLDQVRIGRIEQTGSFPVQVRRDGNDARITDIQLDPGTLCPDRTVTAQYDVAVAGEVTDGRITLAAEAYDVNLRLLARQTVVRDVVSERSQRDPADRAVRQPDEAEETEDVEETEEPASEVTGEDETADGDPTPETGGAAPGAGGAGTGGGGIGQTDAAAGTSGGTGLVQAGFVIGAVLLFLGVGLLIRLRHRLADGDEDDEPAYADTGLALGRWNRRPVARTTARRRQPLRY